MSAITEMRAPHDTHPELDELIRDFMLKLEQKGFPADEVAPRLALYLVAYVATSFEDDVIAGFCHILSGTLYGYLAERDRRNLAELSEDEVDHVH